MFSRCLAAVLGALLLVGCAAEPVARQVGNPPEPTTVETEILEPEPVEVADPETLLIPAIDVTASVVGVGLEPDGAMETPEYDLDETGWYTEGPRPGEPGPAVVVGHVDSRNGPDVFWRLHELEPGDEVIVVDEEGVEYIWEVTHSQQVDKHELPYEEIWGMTEDAVLRLITCAGEYTDTYRDNLIVYADPSSDSA